MIKKFKKKLKNIEVENFKSLSPNTLNLLDLFVM